MSGSVHETLNVIDEWIEKEVKHRCKGEVKLFRYADDAVICCQNGKDAQRIKEAFGKRLAKFKLKMNEEKTKMVNFRKQAGNSAAFDFLGFTNYLARSKKGVIIPKLKTIGKRLRSKLKRVTEWARAIRNRLELKEICERFCSKLRSHINYYGVSHNNKKVEAFVHSATRILFKWLNKRSQRKSFNWDSFKEFMKRPPLPEIKICHKLF